MYISRFVKSITVTVGMLIVSAVAMAAVPSSQSNGLGQSWPSAPDVSQNSQWHVYVFTRDNIRYVQVNDSSGVVHTAFAVGGDEILVLPIGIDSDHVSVRKQPQSIGSTINSVVVYHTAQLSVLMVPTSGGTGTTWQVLLNPSVRSMSEATTTNGGTSTGAGCQLENCGGDVVQPL